MQFKITDRQVLLAEFDKNQININISNSISKSNRTNIPSLANYKLISVSDMVEDKSYPNSQLICHTIRPSFYKSDTTSVIEDNLGNVSQINIQAQIGISAGTILSIINPKLTAISETVVVYVEDVTQITEIKYGDPILEQINWNRTDVGTITEELKNRGNRFFADKKYDEAIAAFTTGLQIDPNHFYIKSNRSATYMAAELYGLALEDLDQILEIEPENQKALLRLAKTRYLMQEYKLFEQTLSLLNELFGDTEEYKQLLDRLNKRKEEQSNGLYNLQSLYEQSKNKMFLDHADYQGPIETNTTSGHGNGLYATENVEFGTLLIASKALIATSLENLENCISYKEKDPYFKQIFSKIAKNGNVKDNSISFAPFYSNHFGIFDLPSLINHSCVPNTFHFFIGDFVFIKASRDIKKGEEITIMRISNTISHVKRLDYFTTINFKCLCKLCALDLEMKKTFGKYDHWIDNKFVTTTDIKSLSKCVESLRTKDTVLAKFRVSTLLLHTVKDSAENIEEILKGFRSSERAIQSVKWYELTLLRYQFVPEFEKELENWIRSAYYDGYPLYNIVKLYISSSNE